MSCTPTSNSLERSLSPLSPSDESRFVPHPSISSEDEHFKSSDDDKKKKVDTDTKVQDNTSNIMNNNNTTVVDNTDASKQPNLVAEEEDDEEGGIVGATICFTPEPSPRSSPNIGGIEGNNDATGALSKLDSLNSNSNDYIGSVQGATSDRSNSRKSSSVVMHVASSLDGRSTTEYELLDALSSKGTIEVEELVLDEDDEDCDAPSLDEKKKEEKSGGEVVSAMLASNPSSGATVASDAPFKNPDTSNTQVPAFVVSTMPDDEAVKLDLNSKDVNEEKDMEDTSTSSKVDSRPLTPFKSLHKFWQGQATKGMLGRILGTDISKDDTEEEGAQTTPTLDEPLGTHVDELDGSSGYQQDDEANQTAAVPKTQWLVNCLFTLFSSAVQYVVSCLVTAGLLFGVFVYGYISSILGKMKALVQRILHQRIKKRAIDQVSNDVVEKVLQDAVDKIVLNSKETDVVPPEDITAATNLSKLLFTADEKLQEDKEVSTALEPKEKALLQKINDKVTASVVTKGKEALLALKENRALSSIMSLALISVFLMGSYMLQHDSIGRSQETDDISIHLDASHSLFNLHCVLTHSTSYHNIPLWLMLLSPSSFEDEVATASRYWLFTFTVFSLLSSMLVAFKSKIPFPGSSKPDILTGIWSEEEHQQFLAGYNVHGTKWKLVSAFVPTRTHNQVKAHGCYWMKIRSPARMPKSRKELTPVRTSFGSTLSAGLLSPRTPSSVCSTKSTPRKSNKKAKTATTPTPLKGILVEKSSNQQFDKNVTPRSAERKKRMQNRKMQGSKSDPVKRRVRIQAP